MDKRQAREVLAPPGGSRRAGVNDIGSTPWLLACDGSTPLYFDRGVRKTGKCAARYARYSPATTIGEYMALNPPPHQSKDFRFDFGRGHLRLPPSNALLTIPLPDSVRVQAVACPPPDALVSIHTIANSVATHIVDLGEALPSLSTHLPMPEPIRHLEEPWEPASPDEIPSWAPSLNHHTLPFGISSDAKHDQFVRLASYDTSVAMAHALDSLDGGSNSPPQVGGGPIDELTAFGISVHRQLSFVSTSPLAGPDRDLTPGTYPLDELMAAFSPLDNPDSLEDTCVFRTGFELGAPPMDFRLPGALPDAHVFGIGATEFRSLAALRSRDDWALWEPAVRKEVDHAFKVKRALTYRTHEEMRAARREFPASFEILNLVTPCVIKHDADGNPIKRKFRITIADARARANSKFAAETYSGAIDGSTVRYLTNATLGRRGKYRNLDVQNAYFEGKKIPPEEHGGRSLWAPVPEGWDVLGYETRARDGTRNWFEITGNVPGLRDAGRTWALDCDSFLLAEGFVQSVVDRRVFIKQLSPIPGETLFIVGVYVDDYWTYCEDDDAWDDFYAKWSSRYTASSSNTDSATEFCGTSFTRNPLDGSMSLGCGKLMASMDLLLAPYGAAPSTYDTPWRPTR